MTLFKQSFLYLHLRLSAAEGIEPTVLRLGAQRLAAELTASASSCFIHSSVSFLLL